MRLHAAFLAAFLTPAFCAVNELSDREKKEGWILLFNGRDLTGWDGDSRIWSVEQGAIIGSSDKFSPELNTFLIHSRPYSDFLLTAEVKLRNNNSGIQFRSQQLPGPGWIVSGYQADFSEAGDRSAWGNFYEERGRGRAVMRTQDEGWLKGQKLYRKGDWNRIDVLAQGSRIRVSLNGQVTIDTTDSKASSGIIAIQLHRGDPMRVECRNLKLKPLSSGGK
jgi:hypothetical protein